MRKRILFLATVLSLFLALLPIPALAYAPAPNLNTADTWAHEHISSAVEKGFVPASLQNEYTKLITREEFCRITVKWVEYALGKSIDTILLEKSLTRDYTAFSDTQDPDILAAYALRIINGTVAPTSGNPGVFNPDGVIDRQQAATLIMNACKAIGADASDPPTSDFADIDTADSWALTGIDFVRAKGIMSGVTASPPYLFNPKAAYTRQQSIVTFNNIDFDVLNITPPHRQPAELSSEEVFTLCSPAVFYIEIYNSAGNIVGAGSGFFIDSTGTAVTSYHVIDGAHSAKITVSGSGGSFDVLGVYDYNKNEDWAVIKTDCTDVPFLKTGSTSTITGGSVVYAIGSPLGLQNTISQGIISNPKRTINGIDFIQISAPVSPGSSGGALINRYGDVIGIVTGYFSDGQNLNIALPISSIDGFSKANLTSLPSLFPNQSTGSQNRQQKAYDLLKSWIKANKNEDFDGDAAYYETYRDTIGKYTYRLIYSEEYNNITIGTELESIQGTFYTWVFITADGSSCFVGFSHYHILAGSNPIFSGYVTLNPANFDINSNIRFSAIEGDSSDLVAYQNLVKYFVLEALDFTDYVFSRFPSDWGSFSMADFGFKSNRM